MTKSRTITMAISAVVLLTGAQCGGSPSKGEKALEATKAMLKSRAGVDELLSQRNALGKLPRGEFTDETWTERLTVLRNADSKIMAEDVATIDGLIHNYDSTAAADASAIAITAVKDDTPSVPPNFMTDLREVTEDTVTSVACLQILDRLAPDEKPSEPGKASKAEEAANEAIVKLVARRWLRDTFVNVVDWTYYAKSVAEAADRYAQHVKGYSDAVLQNPNPRFLASPKMREAAVAYVRTCYSPPKEP